MLLQRVMAAPFSSGSEGPPVTIQLVSLLFLPASEHFPKEVSLLHCILISKAAKPREVKRPAQVQCGGCVAESGS